MTHQFGNYVIQKLLDILIYQENKTLFTEVIIFLDQNNSLYTISINNYGTRVIQKTIEKVASNKNLVAKIENILQKSPLITEKCISDVAFYSHYIHNIIQTSLPLSTSIQGCK